VLLGTSCVEVLSCGGGFQAEEGGAGHTSPTSGDISPHCGHDEWFVGVTVWVCQCATYCVSLLLECVQLISEDVKKKRDWQQKLHDMKLKSLLNLRDSLMAIASIHMMRVDDCKTSCVEDVDQVMNLLLFLVTLPSTCYGLL